MSLNLILLLMTLYNLIRCNAFSPFVQPLFAGMQRDSAVRPPVQQISMTVPMSLSMRSTAVHIDGCIENVVTSTDLYDLSACSRVLSSCTSSPVRLLWILEPPNTTQTDKEMHILWHWSWDNYEFAGVLIYTNVMTLHVYINETSVLDLPLQSSGTPSVPPGLPESGSFLLDLELEIEDGRITVWQYEGVHQTIILRTSGPTRGAQLHASNIQCALGDRGLLLDVQKLTQPAESLCKLASYPTYLFPYLPVDQVYVSPLYDDIQPWVWNFTPELVDLNGLISRTFTQAELARCSALGVFNRNSVTDQVGDTRVMHGRVLTSSEFTYCWVNLPTTEHNTSIVIMVSEDMNAPVSASVDASQPRGCTLQPAQRGPVVYMRYAQPVWGSSTFNVVLIPSLTGAHDSADSPYSDRLQVSGWIQGVPIHKGLKTCTRADIQASGAQLQTTDTCFAVTSFDAPISVQPSSSTAAVHALVASSTATATGNQAVPTVMWTEFTIDMWFDRVQNASTVSCV